jgi:eukaryotic-like serine/threonine-protein kinase
VAEPEPTLDNGRYRLEGTLGSGGMATVFRAWDERLQVHRAIKVLAPEFEAREDIRVRFAREAQAMARIRHPAILTVHDVVMSGRQVFMVMEMVEGGTVASHLGSYGAMPPYHAVSLMIEVLEALHAAHLAGVIHRDVKPHNVLVTKDGHARVADFGIAQVSDATSATVTGAVMGTFAYMAPEQLEDAKSVDARADIYAAGAMLYVMLADRKPRELYNNELYEKVYAKVPPILRAIVQKATKYEREERFFNALEMAKELRAVVGQLAVPEGSPALGSAAGAIAPIEAGRSLTPILDAPETLSPSLINEARGPARGSRAPWLVALLLVALGAGGVALLGVAVLMQMVAVPWFEPAAMEETPVIVEPAAPPEPAADRPSPEPEIEPERAPEEAPEPAPTPEPSTRPAPPSPVPAVAPQPSPEPEPVVDATLFVNSVPAGEVLVDGHPRGGTPATVPVAAGLHRVEVRTAGHDPVVRQIDTPADGRTVFCWDFGQRAMCRR